MSEIQKKVRVTTFRRKRERGEKIAILTAYDATMARIFDHAGIDALLVGDSLGMAVMGHESTLGVTMDVMVHHTRAVVRGTQRALVIADMPFLSYQVTADEALRNAGRLLQEGGASAVKLEGGSNPGLIARLVRAGIPVMGHVGLTPQSVHQFGGYVVQGKTEPGAARVLEEAKTVADAGAFAVVLECIPATLASRITQQLSIPTIGIGAGPDCDGQVLVSYDAMGLTQNPPAFVKPFAHTADLMESATRRFIEEVRGGVYPSPNPGPT